MMKMCDHENPPRTRDGVCKLCALKERIRVHRRPIERESKRRRRYGLATGDYDRMLAAQGGRCAICQTHVGVSGRDVLAVDHDHTTGVVRGLLCTSCNTGLGGFKDSTYLLVKAIRYLKAVGGD